MPGAIFLDGDRITLRTIEEEDISFLYKAVNDPRVWPSLFIRNKPPYSQAQEREWVEQLNESEDAVALLICVDDEAVGSVQLQNIDHTVGTGEVSYFVEPETQESGYATEGLTLLIQYAFSHLRLHKVTARTYDFNAPSQRVLEKVGFVDEGVHREEGFFEGEFRDVHYYGLIDRELQDE